MESSYLDALEDFKKFKVRHSKAQKVPENRKVAEESVRETIEKDPTPALTSPYVEPEVLLKNEKVELPLSMPLLLL